MKKIEINDIVDYSVENSHKDFQELETPLPKKNLLFPIRPKFIAKKIEDKSLLQHNAFVSFISLDKVNESPTNSILKKSSQYNSNKLLKFNRSFSNSNVLENKLNIFKKSFGENEIYDCGPKFSENGKIIDYSIVGNPVNFVKIYNKLHPNEIKSVKQKIKRISINSFSLKNVGLYESETPEEKEIDKSPHPSIHLTKVRTSSIDKNEMSRSSHDHLSIASKKTSTKKGFNVSKEQLIDELDELDATLKSKKTNEDPFFLSSFKDSKKISFSDILRAGKDKKIMENFQKYQEMWQNQIEKNSKRLKKNKNETLIASSDYYRNKVEFVESLEMIKNKQEIYGDTYWYSSLRGSNSLKNSELFRVNDLPQAFRTDRYFKKPDFIEKIKKPYFRKIFQKKNTINENLLSPLRQKRRDLLLEKTIKNPKKLDIINPKNLEYFEIKGENILELEKNMLKNDDFDTTYTKIIFDDKLKSKNNFF